MTYPLSKPLLVANWKMNGNKDLIQQMIHACHHAATPLSWIWCLPFPYLAWTQHVLASLSSLSIHLGGQDCSFHPTLGAFTGDVSCYHLKDSGCTYVIIGHSERREYHGETDDMISQKAASALKTGITPIICIGESLSVYDEGKTIPYCTQQIQTILSDIDQSSSLIIAYEPRWAIGTGKTPTYDEIESILSALKKSLSPNILLLYGGSVTSENITPILRLPSVDGVLIGGASLKPDILLNMIHQAQTLT